MIRGIGFIWPRTPLACGALLAGCIALLCALSSSAFAGAFGGYEKASCSQLGEPRLRPYKRVVRDLVSNRTLTIEGPEWNDTLLLNCTIRGAKGDGIRIRNVKNLTIQGCVIEDVSGRGIALRSSGSTSNVSLIGNKIENTGSDGISAAKRDAKGVDHTGLVIGWNVLRNTGERGHDGLQHGIYTQASDSVVVSNVIKADREGNGISIRSSGLVACNRIAGRSKDDKPGIRYFADHSAGPTRTLIIRDNVITGSDIAIELLAPPSAAARRPKSLVQRFDIYRNRSTAATLLLVDDYWLDKRYFAVSQRNNSQVAD